MKKARIGITVIGKDREGIVAAFTNFIFQKDGNIEKINQNVIKGLFGMHLEASFSKALEIKSFDKELQNLGKKLSMDVSVYHEINSQKNIAVFVTKEPHCVEALLDANNKKQLKGKISVIVGTEKTLEPLAKKSSIPFVLVDEREQQKAEDHLIEITKRFDIDLVVLARYMRIMTPNFVWRYPQRIINIHPSLLPAFPGAFAYEQAFERGTKIIGVTAHYVTEELDQGPIIFQDSFKAHSSDTLETIKKKGQKLEAATLLKAVKMHLEGKLEVSWRKVYSK
ncbi:MAG TPA: formyltetrahydrofolate deformylase [Candidatus Nitrosotenuis sp.]|nr:formyltetrahydrofolate deformylase [Candidatus Nitrosotenuis sp.]